MALNQKTQTTIQVNGTSTAPAGFQLGSFSTNFKADSANMFVGVNLAAPSDIINNEDTLKADLDSYFESLFKAINSNVVAAPTETSVDTNGSSTSIKAD